MPRISPHFVCPALLQDALRYTFAYRKLTPTPTAFRVRLCIPRRRLCTQASPLIDDEMGKEDKSKNFNLKVPKGTRDCECSCTFPSLAPLSLCLPAKALSYCYQGLAKMLPSAIASSTP